jgi:hypothetical protein
MTDKFIGYLKLIEACRRGGCPVCGHVREETRNQLDALLYGHVTDYDSRRRLRESWGLCNWHTWMLLEVDRSLFGASIVYEDLLREAIDRVAGMSDGARGMKFFVRRRPAIVEEHDRRSSCAFCLAAAEHERLCLLAFTQFAADGDLQAAYVSSDPICLPHLVRAAELAPDSRALRGLIDRTLEKWRAVRKDLRSFIEKHDHRNQAAFTAEDAASYARAFEIIAGAAGLFGNDLRAARR